MWPFLWLFLFGENFFNFWGSEGWNVSLIPYPHISQYLFCSLKSFYLGLPVLNASSCFLSPWRGTPHKLENHSACLPQPFPCCISIAELVASSTCPGVNSHCRWLPESLSFKIHSGFYKRKTSKKCTIGFGEAVCTVVKYGDHAGRLLDLNPDHTRLSELEQVTEVLLASVSLSVKWGNNNLYLKGLLGLNELIYI